MRRGIWGLAMLTVGLSAAPTHHLLPRDTQLLTAIGEAPTRAMLDEAFLGDAAGRLSVVAAQRGDRAVTIQAVHALALLRHYPSARPALRALVETLRTEDGGEGRVRLRTAIESMGYVGTSEDVDFLSEILGHDQRDVRATTALALMRIGDPAALPALRMQAAVEVTPQVELALLRAIRALE